MPGQVSNVNALKHGAQSLRIVAGRTAAIVEAWEADETLTRIVTGADRAALTATASAYARLLELEAYFESPDGNGNPRGILDSRGRPRGCARLYVSMYREAMAGLKSLGMTPSGRAEIVGPLTAARAAVSAAEAQRSLRAVHASIVEKEGA